MLARHIASRLKKSKQVFLFCVILVIYNVEKKKHKAYLHVDYACKWLRTLWKWKGYKPPFRCQNTLSYNRSTVIINVRLHNKKQLMDMLNIQTAVINDLWIHKYSQIKCNQHFISM